MKNIGICLVALLLFGATACDPIETRHSAGKNITVDQLDISATPLVVDGKNSNKVIVVNHSPVNCEWSGGTTPSSTKSCDTLLMVMAGENTITFKGMNPGGGPLLEKTLTVTVDEMVFPLPPQYSYLSDNGGTWTWDNDLSNGSLGAFGSGGWGNSAIADWDGFGDISGLTDYNGTSPDQKMVFGDIAEGATYTKMTLDGEVLETGTYSLNLTPKAMQPAGDTPYCIGQLTLSNGTSVLSGYDYYDQAATTEISVYDILSMGDDHMILGDGSLSEAEYHYGDWLTSVTIWQFVKIQ